MTLFKFLVGNKYRRDEVMRDVGLARPSTGGAWFTGYVSYGGAHFIFCNIGIAGRTGHDYPNTLEGNNLTWSGKTGSKSTHPQISAMVESGAEVHVFFRAKDRDPFTYAGLGKAVLIEDLMPVRIVWSLTVA